MSYTPPAGDEIVFILDSSYTAPSGDDIVFVLGDDGGGPSISYNRIKVWNGVSWEYQTVAYHTGSAFSSALIIKVRESGTWTPVVS